MMQDQRRQVSLRIAVAAIAVCAGAFALARHLLVEIGPANLMKAALASAAGHSTVYATGYSESGFRSIRVGMTASRVEERLGSPLSRETLAVGHGSQEESWQYSRPSKLHGCHWQRIIFFRDGIVNYIETDYYVD
jgi:hypothetical protein